MDAGIGNRKRRETNVDNSTIATGESLAVTLGVNLETAAPELVGRRSAAIARAARSGGIDALLAEFVADWEMGKAPRIEDFLARLDPTEADDGVELVYQDYCLAETDGLKPDPMVYARRFPEHRERLDRLLRLHSAFDSTILRDWTEDEDQAATLAGFPEAGDEIGPYRLIRELGRGGLARVFLATQTNLENRRVVVKIATRATAEVRLLAKASHPHIVEVLSHAATADGAFHLMTMPFLGGATLGAVLLGRRSLRKPAKTGRDLLADLDRVADPDFPHAELPRPAREILAKLSYPRAVAWIVARLAEALEHAHRQGIAHGDIKPSNILLTADGQPMLFDFNLAVAWSAELEIGEVGGTLAYMAPERLRAIAAPEHATKPSSEDRQRADIYSLGLILLESLSGRADLAARTGARNALLGGGVGRGAIARRRCELVAEFGRSDIVATDLVVLPGGRPERALRPRLEARRRPRPLARRSRAPSTRTNRSGDSVPRAGFVDNAWP